MMRLSYVTDTHDDDRGQIQFILNSCTPDLKELMMYFDLTQGDIRAAYFDCDLLYTHNDFIYFYGDVTYEQSDLMQIYHSRVEVLA